MSRSARLGLSAESEHVPVSPGAGRHDSGADVHELGARRQRQLLRRWRVGVLPGARAAGPARLDRAGAARGYVSRTGTNASARARGEIRLHRDQRRRDGAGLPGEDGAALERHPECDAAHCKLVVVDESGAPLANQWWRRPVRPEPSRPGGSSARPEGAVRRPAVPSRRAGVLLDHRAGSSGGRSSARIGQFEARWGSVSDFNWYMRVGLVADIVHVPDTWATWRVHPKQATDFGCPPDARTPAEGRRDDRGRPACREPQMDPAVVAGLHSRWLDQMRELRDVLPRAGSPAERGLIARVFQLAQMIEGPASVPRSSDA